MDKRLKIVGSSHIAKDSVKRVKKEFLEFEPDIVAIELDKNRLLSLLQKEKKPNYFAILRTVGIIGFIFTIIASYAQKKLGKIVGMVPGSEMKQAFILARKNNKKVTLIDQNIEVTLKKLSKYITWREKWYFIVDIFKALLGSKPKLQFDISKVPSDEIIEKLIIEVKIRYPNVYKVLIEQRNKIMAKKLFLLLRQNKDEKILAVVGAGHKKEMLSLISKYIQEN